MHHIAGITLIESGSHRAFVIAKEVEEQVFAELLTVLAREGQEFGLYDPLYPSPSDPGAYFSYRPGRSVWLMTLGNHGWSGGIYEVDAAVVARQVKNLHRRGLLESVELDGVCFFSHYPPESEEKNAQMNQRLGEIHQ